MNLKNGKRSRLLLVAIALVVVSVSALVGPVVSSFPGILLGGPKKVWVFNDNTEVGGPGIALAAGLMYTAPNAHKLIITLSAVGALIPTGGVPAVYYLGCTVDAGTPAATPCVGHQTNPPIPITAIAWVAVNSNNFPASSSWDNDVGYTWLAPDPLGASLPAGTHEVDIYVAPGAAVPGCPTPGFGGCGGPGITHIEARNLILTLVWGS